MADFARLYDETRVRVSDLVSEANGDLVVPCCPEWRVRDVVGHLTGLAQAWVDQDLDGYASPAWTQAQIDARAQLPVAEVLEEWGRHTLRLLPRLRDPAAHDLPGFMPGITLGDLVTHEHDIRGAIDQPGARDSDAVTVSFGGNLRRLARKLEKAGLQGVRVVTESGTVDVGTGDPVVSLRSSTFEMWRSLSGRRSLRQVESWDWAADPTPVVSRWLEWPFTWPTHDITEPG